MISRRVLLLTTICLAMSVAPAFAQIGLNVGTLTLGTTGSVNMGAFSGIITTSPDLVGTTAMIQTGFNGSSWNGVPGINSSAAAANGGRTALAPVSGAEWTGIGKAASFYGVAITDSTTLIQYTYTGDLNLDGSTGSPDSTILDGSINAINNLNPVTVCWTNGDINYDGSINGATDGTMMDGMINYQNNNGALPGLTMGGAGAGVASVPEPSIMVLGLLAVACFMGFRKFWN